MSELENDVGQVETETSTEATQPTPETVGEQSVANQTTSGPDSETFFDPKDIPEELLPAYKQMQGAFTKRMTEAANHRNKIAAYDEFAKDPLGTMKKLSQQYGYALVEGAPKDKDFNPQTWDDVINKTKDEARSEVLKELQPVLDQVKTMRRNSVETQLNDIDPQWRVYEDQMMETLETHPSLVNDPEKLYRISVPDDVYEKKAYEKALKKINSKASEGQMSGGSRTNKKPSDKPSGPLSFDQAVDAAKAQLASEGIRPGI